MPELKRTLGLFTTTLLGVGVILGAGIYTLVGKAAALAGDAVWMSFVGAATVASLTALSYAELASFIPKAGGEYYYVQRAFGRAPAFLVTWLLLAALCMASAAVGLGFGGYLNALVGTGTIAGALGLIGACSVLLWWGTRESAVFAGLAAALEVFGLLVIIAIGLPTMDTIDFTAMPHGSAGVSAAAALIFFAYIGFEEIVQLAEETEDPAHTIPRALIYSIVLTTVIYVLVALAAVGVLGAEALGASESPLADVAAVAFSGNLSVAIAVIALFSTANTVLVLLLSSSRLLYGLGEDGAVPRVFGRIGAWRRTPHVATFTVALLSGLTALFFQKIEAAAGVVNFAIFLTFLMINATVIALRFKEPDAERPFRIPGSIAGVPLVPCAGLLSVALLMTETDLLSALVGAGILVVGAVGLLFQPQPGGDQD